MGESSRGAGIPLAEEAPRPVSFGDALRFWLKLGFISFGGPTGQIAVMHEEVVTRRRWIGEDRFLHALNFCMLLPGPEAQQLATYIGWLLHGTRGALAAGILFVLPGSLVMLALSWIYAVHGSVSWVDGVFYGLRAAVIAIVAAAVIRIGSKTLKHPFTVALAAAAFIAIFFFRAPFPAIVLGAGLAGLLAGRFRPGMFGIAPGVSSDQANRGETNGRRPAPVRTAAVLLAGLAIWWLPLAAVILWRGPGDTLSLEAIFFSKAAMVTFGGAYAVLPYIGQAAVESYGWLEPRQMLDGLGLAETTPGPLILVAQFVGFLGAFRNPGDLPPMAAATIGAIVTTWATFAPSILWVFLGAPYVERLRGNRALTAALSSITAAVVGVVLNLAVWFSLHALFAGLGERRIAGAVVPVPDLASLDLVALGIAAVLFFGMQRLRWGILPVVGGSAVAGALTRMLS